MLRFLRPAVDIAVFAGCAVLALWSLAALGGAVSDTLDILTHFAPLALAGSLGALAATRVMARRSRLRFVSAVLASAASLWSFTLLTPELLAAAGSDRSAEGQTLKVVTFNVWALNGDPEASAAWLRGQKADLVLLQETDGRYAERVLELTRPAYPHGVACTEVRCSLAVLSRWPIRNAGFQRQRTREGRPLSAAWADIEAPGGTFTALTTHYTWPTQVDAQERQRAGLVRLADRHDRDTLILTGDFNLTPWSKALQEQDGRLGLERRTRGVFSWPAIFGRRSPPFPVLPIDHVYAGRAWRTVSVERGPRLGSDHYPVIVTLSRAGS